MNQDLYLMQMISPRYYVASKTIRSGRTAFDHFAVANTRDTEGDFEATEAPNRSIRGPNRACYTSDC
jgi:hypothetical protein